MNPAILHPDLFRASTPLGCLARGLASALHGASQHPLLLSASVGIYRSLLLARVKAADAGVLVGPVAVHARAEAQALAALQPGELDALVTRAWQHANGHR